MALLQKQKQRKVTGTTTPKATPGTHYTSNSSTKPARLKLYSLSAQQTIPGLGSYTTHNNSHQIIQSGTQTRAPLPGIEDPLQYSSDQVQIRYSRGAQQKRRKMVAGAQCMALKVDTFAAGAGAGAACRCYDPPRNRRLLFQRRAPAVRAGGSNGKPNAVNGSARVCEWQSTCAILNGQLMLAKQQEENGTAAAAASSSGTELVPVTPATPPAVVAGAPLPKPLSIAGLEPGPLHGASLRVAYQGVPGAFSEAAASRAYPGCEAVPCEQFEAAFQAVELWVADRAVLPVENSLGGSIHRNYDLLLRHRLHIVGEVQLPVHHCLLALPGVRKEDIRRVISHPQALSQCEHSISAVLGGGVTREAVDDTAGAAQIVAENYLRDTAAVASARAADIYGLNVLADGVQDDASNVTRFVMLAREPIIPRTDRPFKTSIVFAHSDEGTGVLFKVLSAFAFRDLSLTKIESRPQRNRPLRVVDDSNLGTAKYFEYLFYIDFEASMADPRAQNALAELQEFTTFLRVLGSYPMDMTPLPKSVS